MIIRTDGNGYRFAGYIKYDPYTNLTEWEIYELKRFLENSGYSDGPENQESLIDFAYLDDDPNILRTRAVLFMDGGDGEYPTFIVCRFDDHISGKQVASIHVPDPRMQAVLLELLGDLRNMKTVAVNRVGKYIESALRKPKKWRPWPKIEVKQDE